MSKPSFICIDLDGVLVDMHTPLVRLFGEDPSTYTDAQWREVGQWGLSIPKDNFWEKIRAQGSQWWINLPKLPWTDELWESALATGATCVVLTTPGPFPESAYGKWQWVNDNLHTQNVLIGQPKEVCAKPGSWLIDDRAGYGPKWEGNGGTLLSLKRPWNPEGMTIEDILKTVKEIKA